MYYYIAQQIEYIDFCSLDQFQQPMKIEKSYFCDLKESSEIIYISAKYSFISR